VTTSFIAVPHLEHERGLALGFVATHAPCVRSIRRVLLDANALCVAWFGVLRAILAPGRNCERSGRGEDGGVPVVRHAPEVRSTPRRPRGFLDLADRAVRR
jgi:hypothetical protein